MSQLVDSLSADGLMAFHLTDSKHREESEHHSVSYMGVLKPHASFAAAMDSASIGGAESASSSSSASVLKHRHIDIKAYPREEMVSLLLV